MPLPTNVSTGTIKGQFLNVAGDPNKGTVTFTPSFNHGVNGGADVIFTPETVKVNLDAQGKFNISIAATDDPDLAPLNFTYSVSISIYGTNIPVFTMSLPSGSTRDLTDVIP